MVRTTITNKLTAIVLTTSIMLGCSKQITPEEHIAAAKQHLAAQEPKSAVIELKNAIQADPKNALARYLLGEIYLSSGNGLSAEKELSKAYELGYDKKPLLPKLARAYALTEQDQEILALAAHQELLSGENLIQFLAYKTLALLRTNEAEQAKASVALAMENDANNAYTLLAQAYIDFAEQKSDKAITATKRVLTARPDQVDAILLQGQIAMSQGNYQLASENFEKFIALQPDTFSTNLLLADALFKDQQYVAAEKYIDIVLTALPKHGYTNYLKAAVLLEKKAFKEAKQYAENAIGQNFKTAQVKLIAGVSSYFSNNHEMSYYYLNDIESVLPANHPARKMLAISQIEIGEIEGISENLAGLSGKDAHDSDFLSALSYQLLTVGDKAQAKALLTQSEGEKTTSSLSTEQQAKVKARAGILKLLMNEPGSAEEFEKAIDLDPDFPEAELALVLSSLKAGDIENATTLAIQWQNKYPQKVAGKLLLARIYMSQQAYDDAQEIVDQALASNPEHGTTLVTAAQLSKLKGQNKEAHEFMLRAHKVAPDSPQVLGSLFQLALTQEDADKKFAIEAISQAYERNKASTLHIILQAQSLLAQRKLQAAVDVLKTHTPDIKTPNRYWQILTATYNRLRQFDNVTATLDAWQKTSPHLIDPVLYLVDFYINQRKPDLALTQVNQALTAHVNNNLLLLVKAQLLLKSRQPEQAKLVYTQIDKSKLEPAVAQGVEGHFALIDKDFAKAESLLKASYDAAPSNQKSYLLTMTYDAQGKQDKAIAHLKAHLNSTPTDLNGRQLLANYTVVTDPDAAIAQYQEIVKVRPKNYLALNNLAWLHMEKGQLEAALDYSERAYESAPEHPNVADTLSMILLKQGEIRKALPMAEKAYNLSQGTNVEINLNYVEILIKNARKLEARNVLDKTFTENAEQQSRKSQLVDAL